MYSELASTAWPVHVSMAELAFGKTKMADVFFTFDLDNIYRIAQEISSDTGMYNTVPLCAITVLHEHDVSWNAKKHPHHR